MCKDQQTAPLARELGEQFERGSVKSKVWAAEAPVAKRSALTCEMTWGELPIDYLPAQQLLPMKHLDT